MYIINDISKNFKELCKIITEGGKIINGFRYLITCKKLHYWMGV